MQTAHVTDCCTHKPLLACLAHDLMSSAACLWQAVCRGGLTSKACIDIRYTRVHFQLQASAAHKIIHNKLHALHLHSTVMLIQYFNMLHLEQLRRVLPTRSSTPNCITPTWHSTSTDTIRCTLDCSNNVCCPQHHPQQGCIPSNWYSTAMPPLLSTQLSMLLQSALTMCAASQALHANNQSNVELLGFMLHVDTRS